MLCKPRARSTVKSTRAKNTHFDLWSKDKSHGFTIEILRLLGYQVKSEDAALSLNDQLHRLFSDLPMPDYNADVCPSYSLVQAHALFAKNADIDMGIDTEEVAYRTFIDAERQCHITNARFKNGMLSKEAKIILAYAQEYCARILGPIPPLDELRFAFGPGATSNTAGNKTTAVWKLSDSPSITAPLLPCWAEIKRIFPAWLASANPVVLDARLEFVEKSYKTKRSVMITSTISTMLQKGYGSHIRSKLLAAGVNLNNQSASAELARLGSLGADFVTIDLKSASDTIAYLLVMNLLPWDWFIALDQLRDQSVIYHNVTHQLQKFSAMGNGYTFELESLIFRALISGICRYYNEADSATVYGDDLITTKSVGEHICRLFPEFGFTINSSKTFLTGKFRESCGSDYFSGVDIRPFYLRGFGSGRWTTHKLYSFHNFLCKKPWFDATGEIRQLLLSRIPEGTHKWGPAFLGDGVLHSQAPLYSYALPYGREKQYEGYLLDVYTLQNFEEQPPDNPFIAAYAAYSGMSSEGPVNLRVTRYPKGLRGRTKIRRVYVVEE